MNDPGQSVNERADSELLTLDQAAERLGWRDKSRPQKGGRTARADKLRAAILAREESGSVEILHRRRRSQRTTLRVTMHSLREHLPELFQGARSRLTDEGAWRRMMRSLDERLDARLDDLGRQVSQVEHDGQVTREMVFDVTERLDKLVGPAPPKDPRS